MPSRDAFNAWLEAQCRKCQAEILPGHAETIGARLTRDRKAMADLPAAPFDACDQATGRVSSQALVRYKTNDYSVPVAYGHRDVWIRGYGEVVIGCGGGGRSHVNAQIAAQKHGLIRKAMYCLFVSIAPWLATRCISLRRLGCRSAKSFN